MREILFRGKRIDNGDWVYGSLIITPFDERLILPEGCDYFQECPAIVIPETVGQYTGLRDKNGTKIFEGDVVKHTNGSELGYDIGCVYWDDRRIQFRRTSNGWLHKGVVCNYCLSPDCEYEVIGNIHDNPELIGGVGNDEP